MLVSAATNLLQAPGPVQGRRGGRQREAAGHVNKIEVRVKR